jgi:hypothetical protein
MHCNKMIIALYVLAMFVCSISMSPISSESNSVNSRDENRDVLEALLANYRLRQNSANLEASGEEVDNDDENDDDTLINEYEVTDSDIGHYMSKKAAPRRIFIGKRNYNSLDDLAEYQKRESRHRQNRYLSGKRNGQIHRIFIGKRGDIKRIFIG